MRALEAILEKRFCGQSLKDSEIAFLLATPPGKPLERLFAAARAQRERVFGDQLFCYGFVYFSTYCRNHCHFCLYRQCNQAAPRYRKGIEAITGVARALEDAGVHLIDLTMGEDPYYLQQDGEKLLELVARCREAVGSPIMVSPGVLNAKLLVETAHQGVDWYACYQETFNRILFHRLRNGQDFKRRLDAKVQARQSGLLIEEGLLLGVGETLPDMLLAVQSIENLNVSQVRAMTFRPQPNTPMDHWQVPDSLDELRTIAAFRLIFPDRLIPASLDVDGLQGLQGRLDAGANVITSLIPPQHSLAGVSRARAGIEEGQRTVSAVTPLIEHLGLKIAPESAYRHWLQKEKWRVGRQDHMDSKSMQPG
jgi:methylornithine synthase